MTSNSEAAQINFNPSWMQAAPVKAPKSNGLHRAFVEEEDPSVLEMIEPVFAKHRYGREDILALIGKDVKPPDGLDSCPFFVEKSLPPIILTDLNETELRLQQNINSSKALSAAHRVEWQNKETSESPGPNTAAQGNPWTVAGSQRTASSFRSTHNRWSTMGAGSSEGVANSRNAKTFGSPFGRSFGQSASGTNGEKSRPNRANPWNDVTVKPSRTHQKSTSEEVGPSNIAESEVGGNSANADPWRNASWRLPSDVKVEKSRQNEALRKESDNSNKGIGRGGNAAWNSKSDSVWSNSVSDQTSALDNLTMKGDENKDDRSQLKVQNIQKRNSNQIEDQPLVTNDQWHYLDPNGVRRGPFDTNQMHTWFINGYFHADLSIVQPGDNSYTPLGDLIRINGALTPFVSKSRLSDQRPSPPISSSSLMQSAWPSNTSTMDSATFAGSEMPFDMKVLEAKERMIVEEQRKLREKEEILRREERGREEKERRMKELQIDLQRQKAEIERKALEKERELEIRQLQVLEFERQQREKLEKMEEQRRLQLIQEEQEKRRVAELEFVRQEQERQRQILEAEVRRKRDEEEQKARSEHEELHRRQADEARLRQANELRLKQDAEHARRIQEEELVRHQQALQKQKMTQKCSSQLPTVAPWVTATKGQKTRTEDKQGPHRSLLEIQLEEERQLRVRKQEDDELRRQTEVNLKKAAWNAQPAGNAWNVPKNVPKPVPIPPTKEPVKQLKSEKKNKVVKDLSSEKTNNPLNLWVIQRVRQLNPNVDPEVFATFLQSIDSPNEVEDYVITYFGENKSAKEFHQEFLAKRIELRPRRQRLTDKEDDLSGPAAAATDIAGNGASAPGANNPGGSKGKKSKKTKKVVDGMILGFRPAGDPNRLNVGEIDNTPPVPVRRR